MGRNWGVKSNGGVIVLSSAYQQASVADGGAQAKIDPDNKRYWRMNRKRVEGELIREAVLEIAGALNPRLGGQPGRVTIEKRLDDVIFTGCQPRRVRAVWPGGVGPHRRARCVLNTLA